MGDMEDDFDNWLAERAKDISIGEGELSAGTLVGDYRIVALLGHGGFADVYRATGQNGVAVAIKMLHKLDGKSRARFVRESEILSQIKHRNIPRLLSFGSYGDRPYMVTELLKGYELPGTDHKIVKFLEQIMSAVEELHRHGFVHRDIKPDNILSRDDGTPVLIDFGLVSPVSPSERETEALSIEDGKHVAVGTVGYSAPEQFSGLPADRAADVHAIGALINACYQGKMPGCWRRIYLAATASDPKSRYQTVQELRRAVRVRHWRKAAFLVLVMVLFGALVSFFVDMSAPSAIEAPGYIITKAKTMEIPVKVPGENRYCTIRCQVIYLDGPPSRPQPDGDEKIVRPSESELMSWLKDFVAKEEFDDCDGYMELLDKFIDEDFPDSFTRDFKDYIVEKLEEDAARPGIDVRTVIVDPEGALKEDYDKRKSVPLYPL